MCGKLCSHFGILLLRIHLQIRRKRFLIPTTPLFPIQVLFFLGDESFIRLISGVFGVSVEELADSLGVGYFEHEGEVLGWGEEA